jgi:hypothetical protein
MFQYKKFRKPARRELKRRAQHLRFESLEPRTMFDGNGLLLTNDAYLTLSFAADGTKVAGQSNGLAAKFDAIAPRSVWEDAILSAFQSWAVHTNADVGVVNDGGQPFGTPGPTRGDSQFGDIRIGAIAMDPLVGGESTPIDRLVGGTWQADVVFNTNFDFHSLNDIYEIALHEAGHVFGLDDNSDPNSPLHSGTIPTAAVPDANDIANLHALYGTRLDDFNEHDGGGATSNNDSLTTATVLVVANSPGITPGSAPVIAYGDITTSTDVDYFRLKVPDTYSGAVNVEVRSAGISLLAPHMQVFDANHQLVDDVTSTSTRGDTLEFSVPNASPNDIYYVRVTGASANGFGLGGYSIKATFDDVPQVDLSVLSQYRENDLRKLSQDEIRKLIVPFEDHFLNEDLNADDDLATAISLQSRTDFTDSGRYETIGSISDNTDRDVYRLKSPQTVSAPSDVLTVTVRTLSAGKFVPTVRAFDRNQNPLPVTILANGGGELVLQVTGIESNRNYYLEVAAADPNGPFNLGNYQLSASFQDHAANFQTFATGTLAPGASQNLHTLYVAQPQLFHFLLQAGAATTTGPTAVVATIYNEAGQVVYRVSAKPGESQSQGAVLLAPGTYEVRVATLTFQGSLQTSIEYTLSGTAISDPFASDPNDQTTNPFINPDPTLGGEFLYPGDIPSNDPFLWESFVSSVQGDVPADLQSQITLLLGDWWSWFWGQTGVNGPPLAQADSYSVGANGTLSISAGSGVLANDLEPEGDPMVAAVTKIPRVGALSLNPDGSFGYTPPAAFNGTVQFSYQASDFHQLSNQSTVTISVGLIGDYDHNGVVNQLDYNVWRSTIGSTTTLDADGNGNGVVDSADYVVWRMHPSLGAGSGTLAAGRSALATEPSASIVVASPATTVAQSKIGADTQTAAPQISTPSAKLQLPGTSIVQTRTLLVSSPIIDRTSQSNLPLLNAVKPGIAPVSPSLASISDLMAADIVFSELGQAANSLATAAEFANPLGNDINSFSAIQLL